jgi:hypothetical protein
MPIIYNKFLPRATNEFNRHWTGYTSLWNGRNVIIKSQVALNGVFMSWAVVTGLVIDQGCERDTIRFLSQSFQFTVIKMMVREIQYSLLFAVYIQQHPFQVWKGASQKVMVFSEHLQLVYL